MKSHKQSSLPHRNASGKLDKRQVFRWLQKISHHLLKSCARLRPTVKNNSQKKVHLKRSFPLMVLSLSLSGCMGIYEGGFECPAGTGVGCKSIAQVNTMVDRNQLPGVRGQEIEFGSYDQKSPESFQPIPDSLQIWYAPLMNKVREKASCPASFDEELILETPNGCKEEDGSLSI